MGSETDNGAKKKDPSKKSGSEDSPKLSGRTLPNDFPPCKAPHVPFRLPDFTGRLGGGEVREVLLVARPMAAGGAVTVLCGTTRLEPPNFSLAELPVSPSPCKISSRSAPLGEVGEGNEVHMEDFAGEGHDFG